jgi:hypothetical protein
MFKSLSTANRTAARMGQRRAFGSGMLVIASGCAPPGVETG